MKTFIGALIVGLLLADGVSIRSQLEVLEKPESITMRKGEHSIELTPDTDIVVLYAATREEIVAATRDPSAALKDLPPDQERYIFVTTRDSLKSIEELKALVDEGKAPSIHCGYRVDSVPMIVLPVSVINVELKDAADVEKLKSLAKDLNLEPLEPVPGANPLRHSFEQRGKSKYNFVFDVVSEIRKADFVDFVSPAAPVVPAAEESNEQ